MNALSPLKECKIGFTLIELLVVIAVISVISAFLLPALAKARERARQATCASNLSQVSKAWMLYVQDSDDRTPPAKVCGAPPLRALFFGNPFNHGCATPWAGWYDQLTPYLKNRQVLLCPSGRSPDMTFQPDARNARAADAIGGLENLRVHYALNYIAAYDRGRPGCGTPSAWRPWCAWGRYLATIQEPTTLIAFFDANTAAPDVRERLDSVVCPHFAGASFVFVDGHAKWLKLEQTIQPTFLWAQTDVVPAAHITAAQQFYLTILASGDSPTGPPNMQTCRGRR